MDTTVTRPVNDFAPPEVVHATFSRDPALWYVIIYLRQCQYENKETIEFCLFFLYKFMLKYCKYK